MSDQKGLFNKLKDTFTNLFGKSQPKPEPEIWPPPGARPLTEPAPPPPPSAAQTPPAAPPKPAPTSAAPAAAPGFSLTGLDVMAAMINFARKYCGADYKPEIEVEKMFVIAPKNEDTGSRQMIEWFMSHRPGLVLMVMPQASGCNVTLLYGPNPPTKGTGYLLGLNPVDSQQVPHTVGALEAVFENYITQGTLTWQNGRWQYHKG